MEVTTGALGTLLPKLAQLLHGEYNLQKGDKKDIQFLEDELESMHAFLGTIGDVPAEQLDEQVRMWAREVRELSYDIEDIVDIFLARMQGPEPTSQISTKRFINKMTHLVTNAATRHGISQGIKDINERIKVMAARRSRYKVDTIGPVKTLVDPRITALSNKATDLVGIDEAMEELIELLMMEDESSTEQRRVSIVGFGGLGKTTLAKAVYDKIKGEFNCTAFVSVSQNPNIETILKAVLYQFDKTLYENIYKSSMGLDELSNLVLEFLQNKRYLVVVDDLWNIEAWDTIRCALPKDKKSIIITTTRIISVAGHVGRYCYKMKPLSLEMSKRLFYGRVFGSEHNCPHQLFDASEKILNKCGGVPLAIISISSLLANKPITKEYWYDLCDSIGSGLENSPTIDGMKKILLLSYYALAPHLKTCLLYLSIFPEDFMIGKDRLIWSWIAEGFVNGHGENGLFKLGFSYFNELVNRSMIEPVMIEGTDLVYGCRVHDMVLDLIRFMSHEENFVYVAEGEGQILTSGESRCCRRLAIQKRREERILGDLTRLRSLNAIECSIYMLPTISRFTFLRVLDLQSCGSMEGSHLEHIGELLFLRFMGLRNTFVRKLPKEMGRVKFLQTLDLEGSGVEELPDEMERLTGLMCLNTDWKTRVPDWIGKLTSLQQLVMYPGGGDGDPQLVMYPRELRVLRLLVKAQGEGQLRELLWSLSNLPKVEAVHFYCYGVQLNTGSQLELGADFTLSTHLCSLELCCFEFSRLPAWINAQKLPNLCYLSLMLSDVKEDDLEILGMFPQLRNLHIVYINSEHGKIIITPCSGALFQSLKCFSITTPLKFGQGAMPRLEILDFRFNVHLLSYADKDLDFHLGLENLPSLRQVIVWINCPGAEMVEAMAPLRNAINIHPNHPILEIFSPKSEINDDGTKNKSASSSKSSVPIGVDEPSDKIINKLFMVGNEADNKMRIVSILRSEGRGKTALAQKVFDKISSQFDCAAFVLVGQNPDLRKVFTDILAALEKQKYNYFPLAVMDLMDLIGLVRKSLIYKRFFVVVDDIWDLKAWEIIKCALTENKNRSAVLATSHDINIASDIGGAEQSARLSDAESQKIFYEKLFGSEDRCPRELKKMCEELVGKSCGTLSVIDETVTSFVGIPHTVKDWQQVYDRRIFVLSYPELDGHLKKCLLYFSMFRKGYEISGERLVWAWIAEDFVKEDPVRTLKDVGDSYLSELVNKKMIEAVEVDASGRALSCRVRDFVHDFIISKSTEGNFVAILHDSANRDLPDTVHRLSIQGNNEVHSRPQAWLAQVKSLVVSCDSVSLASIPEFRGLHVMDLAGCGYLKAGHLKSISKITSLKYLVMGAKCMAANHRDIFSKLKALHTLDLSASDLDELPKSVFSLTKLERLCVNSHTKISDGIAKLSALQELGDVRITEPELLKKLCKLRKLRVLRIAIWSWDQNLEANLKQLYCENLRRLLVESKNDIQSLSILTCCSLDFMGENWAPPSLQKLEIRNSAFDTLPSWFGSLSNISSLTIEVYKSTQVIIGTLGKLSTLASLSLTSKQVPDPGYFVIDSESDDSFKSLASLKLVSNAMVQMFALPQPKDTQQRLKRLTIVFQASRTENVNKDFRFGLENLSYLEHIRVEIICFNASHKTVNDAEKAIRAEISKNGTSHLADLDIRRLEEDIVDQVNLPDTVQEQEKDKTSKNKQKRQKKKSSSKKIRVTGNLFRQKRRKELLEYVRPFLD